MIEHALTAIKRGFYVFPLFGVVDGVCTCYKGADCDHPGKHPRIKDNLNQATLDQDQIQYWWKTWPEANIGIATGPSELVVIDIDLPKEAKYGPKPEDITDLFGMDAWIMMVLNAGFEREPRTYEVTSASGGTHLYWQANPAQPIKTRASLLRPGIDVRAVNGSIVGAGSVTPKGTYTIQKNSPIKKVPVWLRRELHQAGLSRVEFNKPEVSRPVINGSNYAKAALKSELEQLRSTPVGAGQRNDALNKAAFKLSKFVGKGQLSFAEVGDSLYSVAVGDLGIPDAEAIATIKSGLRKK